MENETCKKGYLNDFSRSLHVLKSPRMIADSLSEAMSAQKIIRKRQEQSNYMNELLK